MFWSINQLVKKDFFIRIIKKERDNEDGNIRNGS